VPEPGSGFLQTPPERRTRHQSIEKGQIQPLEDFFQIEFSSRRREDSLAAPKLANKVNMMANILSGQPKAVPMNECRFWLSPVQLRDENECQGLGDWCGGTLQDISNANLESPLRQADRAIRIRKPAEFNVNFRDWRAGTDGLENSPIEFSRRFEKQRRRHILKLKFRLRLQTLDLPL